MWDEWFGFLTLDGVDPRSWDLNQMLAAYESQLHKGAKDDAAWRRMRMELDAEPKEVRAARVQAARAGQPAAAAPGRMSVGEAEALLARFAVSDAVFGG